MMNKTIARVEELGKKIEILKSQFLKNQKLIDNMNDQAGRSSLETQQFVEQLPKEFMDILQSELDQTITQNIDINSSHKKVNRRQKLRTGIRI